MNRVTEEKQPDKKLENSNESENENTPLNPAILGVPGSHGIKLPINMLSNERQQLSIKLDERRRSRIQKLEARILAKQKAIKKSKLSQLLPQKPGPSSMTEHLVKGDKDRDSVFARLYRNSSSAGHSKSDGNILMSSKPGITSARNDVKPKAKDPNTATIENLKTENDVEAQNKMVKETHLILNDKPNEVFQVNSATNKVMETLVESLPEKEYSFMNSQINETQELEFFEEEKNEIQNEELKETILETIHYQEEIEFAEEVKNEELKEIVCEETDSQKELEFIEEKTNEIQNEELKETVLETTISQKELEFIEEKSNEIINEVKNTVSQTTVSQKTLEFIEEENEILNEEVKETVSETTVSQKDLEFIEEKKNDMQNEEVKETVFETKVSQASPKMKESKDSQIENISNEKTNDVNLSSKNNPNQKPKPRIRRSLSMLFHQKSRASTISRAFSDQSLNKPSKPCLNKFNRFGEQIRTSIKPPQQPKPKPVKSVSFVTPKNNSLLSSTVLRNQLEEWLNVHGHSFDGYRHLRCFGVVDHLTPGRVTKRSNVEVSKTSYRDHSFDESDKENLTPPPMTSQANEKEVENWLKELYKLITELKYPQERCEEWLTAIKNKCSSCTQMFLYWECRAALDESKGDIQSAIDNYQKAKDIESGGDSLANMFDKMVLEQKTPSKSKVEKGIDPKNIFKSTVIKFALQQKNTKECGTKDEQMSQAQNLVVTPVRRSSRIRTPSKNHIVSSLQSLAPESREKVIFKPNMSFLE